MDCLFCKIKNGEIPSKKVYEDDEIYAFFDISPEAPTHFLVIPKTHIASADAICDENKDIVANIFSKIPLICKQLQITNGYRIVTNIGEDGGQTVEHLHFHVLAGRKLTWPAG